MAKTAYKDLKALGDSALEELLCRIRDEQLEEAYSNGRESQIAFIMRALGIKLNKYHFDIRFHVHAETREEAELLLHSSLESGELGEELADYDVITKD